MNSIKHQRIYNEIKDLNSYDYIDTLGYTSEDIENILASSELKVTGLPKSDFIENQVSLPPFAAYFYYYLYSHKQIPTQEEFIHSYIKFYYPELLKIVPREEMKNLRARLSRFYPSIIRDLHFYHLLKESNQFQAVLFNLKMDLEGKVDVFVKQNGRWYGLQLRTLTARSNYYYEKKKYRNPIETKAVLLDTPIDLSNAKNVKTKGESLKLYTTKHIQDVINVISQLQKGA